jgi:IclR family mhp operon transcriptional activator
MAMIEGGRVSSTRLDNTTSISGDGAAPPRIRTNSRRGLVDASSTSYPPVGAVHRAFKVLRAVNRLRIASVNGIHKETGMPKPTIVRMLETFMDEGYIARDNMCGGYRVTRRINDLTSGYEGISQIIEVSRPLTIDLTERIKWPISLGVVSGDAISIRFWTGAISPWVYANTMLGLRPDLQFSAMGRAYLAFCQPEELERHLALFRADAFRNFDKIAERRFRLLLRRAREDGFATRDPRTKPYRTSTLAMPIHESSIIRAAISISFFKSAVPPPAIEERIVAPLRETTAKIEKAFALIQQSHQRDQPLRLEKLEIEF